MSLCDVEVMVMAGVGYNAFESLQEKLPHLPCALVRIPLSYPRMSFTHLHSLEAHHRSAQW
jgi:hypothetical protein